MGILSQPGQLTNDSFADQQYCLRILSRAAWSSGWVEMHLHIDGLISLSMGILYHFKLNRESITSDGHDQLTRHLSRHRGCIGKPVGLLSWWPPRKYNISSSVLTSVGAISYCSRFLVLILFRFVFCCGPCVSLQAISSTFVESFV